MRFKLIFSACYFLIFTSLLCPAPAQQRRSTFYLRNKQITMPMQDREIKVPLDLRLETEQNDDGFSLDIMASGNLLKLQEIMPDIVVSKVAKNDECDEIIDVRDVRMDSFGNRAELFGTVRYEKWKCPWAKNPLSGERVSLGKHRLINQTADAVLTLTPYVSNNEIKINAIVRGLDAPGLLGELLKVHVFGDWVKEELTEVIPQTFSSGNISEVLPASLKPFKDRLQLKSAEFFQLPSGELGFRIKSLTQLTQEEGMAMILVLMAMQAQNSNASVD